MNDQNKEFSNPVLEEINKCKINDYIQLTLNTGHVIRGHYIKLQEGMLRVCNIKMFDAQTEQFGPTKQQHFDIQLVTIKSLENLRKNKTDTSSAPQNLIQQTTPKLFIPINKDVFNNENNAEQETQYQNLVNFENQQKENQYQEPAIAQSDEESEQSSEIEEQIQQPIPRKSSSTESLPESKQTVVPLFNFDNGQQVDILKKNNQRLRAIFIVEKEKVIQIQNPYVFDGMKQQFVCLNMAGYQILFKNKITKITPTALQNPQITQPVTQLVNQQSYPQIQQTVTPNQQQFTPKVYNSQNQLQQLNNNVTHPLQGLPQPIQPAQESLQQQTAEQFKQFKLGDMICLQLSNKTFIKATFRRIDNEINLYLKDAEQFNTIQNRYEVIPQKKYLVQISNVGQLLSSSGDGRYVDGNRTQFVKGTIVLLKTQAFQQLVLFRAFKGDQLEFQLLDLNSMTLLKRQKIPTEEIMNIFVPK